MFTPPETVAAEEAITDAYRGPLFEGPVAVSIDYWPDGQTITISESAYTSALRSDLDNLVKLSLDGLQRAGAYQNDRQVHELWVAKQAA